jgi:hypothetical protein
MALTSNEDISSLKIGRVTQQSQTILRLIHQFFGLKFKITECEDDIFNDDDEEEEEGDN